MSCRYTNNACGDETRNKRERQIAQPKYASKRIGLTSA